MTTAFVAYLAVGLALACALTLGSLWTHRGKDELPFTWNELLVAVTVTVVAWPAVLVFFAKRKWEVHRG